MKYPGKNPSGAHAVVPRGGESVHHPHPAGKGGAKPVSEVGNETRADMKGAIHGQPEDHNPLRGATRELHKQHPIAYHEHGPHHGTTHHIRHEGLHGLHSRGSHGKKRV